MEKEWFTLRSIAEDGTILDERKVEGTETEPFEGNPDGGKGKLIVLEEDFEITDEHDHFEWERAND